MLEFSHFSIFLLFYNFCVCFTNFHENFWILITAFLGHFFQNHFSNFQKLETFVFWKMCNIAIFDLSTAPQTDLEKTLRLTSCPHSLELHWIFYQRDFVLKILETRFIPLRQHSVTKPASRSILNFQWHLRFHHAVYKLSSCTTYSTSATCTTDLKCHANTQSDDTLSRYH